MTQYVVVNEEGKYIRTKGSGKGRGTNDESTLKGKDHPLNKKHKSYYFDTHPNKANGRRVVKCKTSGCYGCALDGNKRPPTCTRCDAAFDYGIKPGTRSPSPAPSEKGNHGNNKPNSPAFDANEMYASLEKQGLEHTAIVEILKEWKIDFKPKTVTSTSTLSTSAVAITKIDGQLATLDNQIKGAHTKHENLMKQLEQCESSLSDLIKSKKELHLQKQRLYDSAAAATSKARVANAMAAQSGDVDIQNAWNVLDEEIIKSVPKESQDAVYLHNLNLMQTAQIAIQRQVLQNEELQKDKDALEIRLKNVEDAVRLAAQERAKVAADLPPQQQMPQQPPLQQQDPTQEVVRETIVPGPADVPIVPEVQVCPTPMAVEPTNKQAIEVIAVTGKRSETADDEDKLEAAKKRSRQHRPDVAHSTAFEALEASEAGTYDSFN